MVTSFLQSGTPARHEQLLTTLEGLLAMEATEPKSALNQATDLVARTLGADKVDVFLYDATIDTLVALGTSNTPMGRKQQALGLDRLSLSNGGKTAEVFRTGRPYHSGHVEQDPDELPGIKGPLGVRSALVVPLDVDGRRRGAMQVDSAEVEQFLEEDLVFLQAVAHWVGMLLHRAELVERIAQEAAEQARRRAADELITILAHDLRAPLTPVRGYVSMILKEAERSQLPPTVTTYAKRALRGMDRLVRMITTLLDTSRLEQGLFTLTPDVVDLAALARETVELLRTPTNPVEVRATEPVVLEADGGYIRQVLENLINNAQRYSPEGMPVIVEVTTEQREGGSVAVLTVDDAGPGIAPEMLPRIFTRFASTESRQGLGLGLYLARGIAHAHGGTLTVDSMPGKGASFRLVLPQQANEQTRDTA